MTDPVSTPQEKTTTSDPKPEKDVVRRRWLVWGIVLLIGSAVATHVGLWWFHKMMVANRTKNPDISGSIPSFRKFQTDKTFPHLQLSPQLDLQTFRKQEENVINTYGWIDRQRGIVRVPISRAMDLSLQKGFPTRRSNQSAKTGPSALELQKDRRIEGGTQ